MYTLDNTINDILKDTQVWNNFSYMMPEFFVLMVPEDMRDMPLRELKDKLQMPWGTPYLAEGVVDVANSYYALQDHDKYEFVQLWTEHQEEDYFPRSDSSKEGIALLLLKETFKPGRPVALIVPGGAYANVSVTGEGLATARALMKHEYAIAIMNYRCAPVTYPGPQADMALAIKYLRAHAKETGVNADDLLAIGFSAGGHLVASETLYHEEAEAALMKDLKESFPTLYQKYQGISAKANKVCLSYPVINFVSEQHEESFQNLSGGNEVIRDKLSIDLHVDSTYPKAFVWACDDDNLVPASNAKRMHEALSAAGVENKYIAYPTGDHGIASGEGTSAEGWVDVMAQYMK